MRGKGRHLLIFASGQLDKIGGVQRSYQILTGHLAERGWKVTIWGFGSTLKKCPAPGELSYPLNKDVNVEIISSGSNERVYCDLLRKVELVNPNIVLIVNSSSRAAFYAAISRKLAIPFVYSMRGSTEYCLRYLWPCRKVFDLPFLAADFVHLLMPSYKNILPESVQRKVVTIPSQIVPATEKAHPDKPNEFGRYKIVYSGRLSFEKQLHYLIQAFSEIAESFPDWDLVIVGIGPLEKKLKQQAIDLDINSRVEWKRVNGTDEMYELYPKMHIKVLPSEYEGCPMALREAMAHALPVIAYASCSGSNEIITHERDGLLAQSSNPVQGLVDSLSALMSNPEERGRLGLNAVEKADKYMPEPINQAWESLLLDAIENRKQEIVNDSSSNFEETGVDLLTDIAVKSNFSQARTFDRDLKLYKRFKTEYLTIYRQRLFDVKYYLECYFDVKASGCDPLLHYISEGWIKGYNPSPEFDTNHYAEVYLGDNSKDACPLYHYYSVGAFLGYFPYVVDSEYLKKWPNRAHEVPYSIVDDFTSVVY